MVKADDFLNTVCNELNYRFFSGVVVEGFLKFLKAMSSEFMHYVPAANEEIALGIACGAFSGGLKSCILFDMKFKEKIYYNFNFVLENKIPLLLLGYSENKKENFKYDIPIKLFSKLSDIKSLDLEMEKKSSPGLLIIGKDGIS